MIYLIADTHFNHTFMVDVGLRVAECDRKLWRSLAQLREADTLYHLGDVSIGDDANVHRMLNELCAAKRRILVRGNHDQRGLPWFYEKGWTAVMDGAILTRFGKTFLLSHMPSELPHWIDVNIHGHIHAGVHRRGIDDGRHVNVSCEVTDYKPVALEYIAGRFK